jgi:flagellar basal-body rod protein FlgB
MERIAVFDSVTMNALTSALDGLGARQRAIANNIANVNTPGYQAQRVSFEEALAESVKAGSGVIAPTTKVSLDPSRIDGNNVNLDTETLSNIDTVLRYQFASNAASSEFNFVRAALGS